MERWERFETYCRETLGLAGTPGSGNQWHDKGDGTTRDVYDPWPLQIDAKTTIGTTFSINRKLIEDWIDQAVSSGRRFAMPVRFLKTRYKGDTDLVVMDFNDFAELVDIARRKSFSDEDVQMLKAVRSQVGEQSITGQALQKTIDKIEECM